MANILIKYIATTHFFDGICPDFAPGGYKRPDSRDIAKAANVISISYGGDEPGVFPVAIIVL